MAAGYLGSVQFDAAGLGQGKALQMFLAKAKHQLCFSVSVELHSDV